MRRLPAIDRCILARGIFFIVENEYTLNRSYQLDCGSPPNIRVYPETLTDQPLEGLGADYAISTAGDACDDESVSMLGRGFSMKECWRLHLEKKWETYQTKFAKLIESMKVVDENEITIRMNG